MVWNHFKRVKCWKSTTDMMIENIGLNAKSCILRSKKGRRIFHFVHTLTRYRSLGKTVALNAAHGNGFGVQPVDRQYVLAVVINVKLKINWYWKQFRNYS